MTVTAHDIAQKLREIADGLDNQPDAEMRYAFLHFGADTKEQFLNAAKLMPRPFKKGIVEYSSGNEIRLSHQSEKRDVQVWATAPQSFACTLIKPAQPAVYDCEPLLSQEEESQLEVL